MMAYFLYGDAQLAVVEAAAVPLAADGLEEAIGYR
jgi:hypothetical protein